MLQEFQMYKALDIAFKNDLRRKKKNICDKYLNSFRTKDALQTHMKIVHSELKAIECDKYYKTSEEKVIYLRI